MKFERIEPTIVMGELSKTLCDMHATRVMLDAGLSKKEIAAALSMHEYKAGLMIRAVSGVGVSRLSRAVELCAEADAALKRSSNDYAAIEKLICAL